MASSLRLKASARHPRSSLASIAVVVIVALAGLVGAASASSTAESTSAPSPVLATGFTDYNLTSSEPALFSQAAGAGAQWVRLAADWFTIGPFYRPHGFNGADPRATGYEWTDLDQTVRLAAAHHLRVLLNIDGAPPWALGPHAANAANPDSWSPNPHALAAFAHALAVRYSGNFPDPLHAGQKLPKVSYFQIWNEPNLAEYLSPQWKRTRSGKYVAASPGIYRSMLNDAYAQIKSAQPHAVVLAAGTAPYGDSPGGVRMKPLTFMEDLFCLSGSRLTPQKCPAVHLDGLDNHPYSGFPTQRASVPGDAPIEDMSELEHVAAVAVRDHHILPAGPKPYWVTEISWGSTPPETPGDAFRETPAVQARYLSLAFYELWRQDVSHILWYLVKDNPGNVGFVGAGVYYQNSQAKPAETAFRFPFATLRDGRGKLTVWGRAPVSGRVVIQRESGSRWVPIATLSATAGRTFLRTVRSSPRVILRAVSATVTSLPFGPAA